MTTHPPATVHASAVLVGARAVLVRGPSGSGKSRLVLDVLENSLGAPFARLIGDDRIRLEACHGRLIAMPAAGLGGLLEVRGLGLRRLAFEPAGVVGLVVDLSAPDAVRLPEHARSETEISGIRLPRIAVAETASPRMLLWSWFSSQVAIV
jgi:serine kinase of HPr protein (carbohydrate metabolism regulator)